MPICLTLQLGKCLVTGSNGFIGSHLVESLAIDPFNRVHAVDSSQQNLAYLKDAILHNVDLADKKAVLKVVTECAPDRIFHLAAVSSISLSWQNPSLVFDTNVKGTINLFDAVRSAGINPMIIVTCSSSEYDSTGKIPLKEDSPLRPNNPYAVSKVAQDFMAELYANAYGMNVVRARPFFPIGPRQLIGACADFARGMVSIERGRQKKLYVGNLSPVVDVLDVRDAVDALLLLADRGEKGRVYNICSGKGHTIKQLLDTMASFAQCPIEIEVDPAKYRPQDYTALVGDSSRLRQLGWNPQIPIETTLKDILDYWRKELKTNQATSRKRKEIQH